MDALQTSKQTAEARPVSLPDTSIKPIENGSMKDTNGREERAREDIVKSWDGTMFQLRT